MCCKTVGEARRNAISIQELGGSNEKPLTGKDEGVGDGMPGVYGMIIRIKAPHFTAGIEPLQKAAPIIRYMLDWSAEDIIRYCKKKNWKYEIYNEQKNRQK